MKSHRQQVGVFFHDGNYFCTFLVELADMLQSVGYSNIPRTCFWRSVSASVEAKLMVCVCVFGDVAFMFTAFFWFR
jgi:hypothetical protein